MASRPNQQGPNQQGHGLTLELNGSGEESAHLLAATYRVSLTTR